MRKLLFFVLALILVMPAYADTAKKPKLKRLNKVVLQLSAEQWVTTASAKVKVTINATLNKVGLAKLHHMILTQLKKISSQG